MLSAVILSGSYAIAAEDISGFDHFTTGFPLTGYHDRVE